MESTIQQKIIFPTSEESEPQERLQQLAGENGLDMLSPGSYPCMYLLYITLYVVVCMRLWAEFASFMDERDVFSGFREEFHFPPVLIS